jgi:hypothetical protein
MVVPVLLVVMVVLVVMAHLLVRVVPVAQQEREAQVLLVVLHMVVASQDIT